MYEFLTLFSAKKNFIKKLLSRLRLSLNELEMKKARFFIYILWVDDF